MSPRTPPTPARSTLPTPPDSIQKYSDALRRAMSARFEEVAQAGLNLRPPPDAATDTEYGFDENPFDTHARLLSSFAESSAGPSSRSSSKQQQQQHDEPMPQLHLLSRYLPDSPYDYNYDCDSDPDPEPTITQTLPLQPRRPKRVLDLTDDDVVLDSPAPSPRRRSLSASLSRTSSFSCSTPSSEVSFEIGRSSDYMGLYGRRLTPRTPPACSPLASNDRRNSNSVLGSGLRPLTALTPSPLPQKRSRTRSRGEHDMWNEQVLARTTSETMLLEAGLASQRGRRCRVQS